MGCYSLACTDGMVWGELSCCGGVITWGALTCCGDVITRGALTCCGDVINWGALTCGVTGFLTVLQDKTKALTEHFSR